MRDYLKQSCLYGYRQHLFNALATSFFQTLIQKQLTNNIDALLMLMTKIQLIATSFDLSFYA
jgi:hypothetical protein